MKSAVDHVEVVRCDDRQLWEGGRVTQITEWAALRNIKAVPRSLGWSGTLRPRFRFRFRLANPYAGQVLYLWRRGLTRGHTC